MNRFKDNEKFSVYELRNNSGVMSADAKRRDDMPAVVNSSASRPTISRNSMLPHSNSNSDSGRVDVLMDVSNNWSPHSAPGGLLNNKRPANFWKRTIAVVMMPFVLIGAPVLSSIETINQSNQIDSTGKWLKSILSNAKLIPVNISAVLITTALNIWLLYLLSDIVVKLFILGEVPKYFGDTLYEFFEIIPIILAVDLFWIKGYLIKEAIHDLDTISIDSNRINTNGTIIKLLIVYVMCFSLHIISFFTFRWRLKFGYTSETTEEYFEHLPHRLVNTFLIPVYIAFCCAIHARYQKMNAYLKRLVHNSERPDSTHLREIKYEFKINGQLIARINSTFNLVMSAFFAVILVGVARDLLYTFYSILAYTSFVKAATIDPKTYEKDFLKDLVRCISADVLVLGMKFSLIGITIIQMIAVNHESRSAPIHLNDFFSQLNHLISSELYRSFRLVKYYMTSRLEKTDKPSLLKISLLSSLPFVKSSLSTKI